ncbi:hypothetical protein SSX86_024629 [Deinandra increscens subsp. villosa]|uniref:HIT domain-containing protein n=1 Tax=Deinandra increscens subsp. villosa TaxID=3103831 RepID=A0AAP0CGD9_9ASTR
MAGDYPATISRRPVTIRHEKSETFVGKQSSINSPGITARWWLLPMLTVKYGLLRRCDLISNAAIYAHRREGKQSNLNLNNCQTSSVHHTTKIVSKISEIYFVVAAMCSKVPYISKAIMKATDSDSFNLLVNNGADAGQVIFHTHIHIIPRRAQDYLWASESLKRQPLKLDQEACHLVNSIKQQLSFEDRFEDSKDHGTTLIGS